MLDRNRMEQYSAVFGILGRLHRLPPNAAALASLDELTDNWPLSGSADTEEGLARWRRSVRSAETPEQIDRDHDRLYGVSAVARVSPFESVHREEEPLVFGASTLQVRASYEALGLQTPALNREPDDHIGLEFDFVSQALARAVLAADNGEQDAAAGLVTALDGFVQAHLQAWAPAMLEKVAAAADTEFMAGLALLSRGALDSLTTELAA